MIINIAHLADLHIGSHQYGIKKRKQNSYKNNLKIAKETSQNHEFIIVAGDVFDSSDPSPDDVKCWIDMCNTWKNNQCKVIACTGNHDKVASGVQWVELGNPLIGRESDLDNNGETFLAEKSIEDQLRVVCINHTKKSELKSKIEKIPDDLDIIIMHQSAGHFLPSIMRPELEEEDIVSLSKKCKYLALGDLHIHRKKKIGNCVIAYPGNIDFLRLCDPIDDFKYISLKFCTNSSSFKSYDSISFEPIQKAIVREFISGEQVANLIKQSNDFNIFRYSPDKTFEAVEAAKKLNELNNESDLTFYFHKNSAKKKVLEEKEESTDEDKNTDFIDLAKKERSLEENEIKIIEDIWLNPRPELVHEILSTDLKKELNENIESSIK